MGLAQNVRPNKIIQVDTALRRGLARAGGLAAGAEAWGVRQRSATITRGPLVAFMGGSLLAGCTPSTSVAENPSAAFSPAPVVVDACSLLGLAGRVVYRYP
jgi:hypothetical protein